MREIKFRGLSANGEFVYGYLTKDLPNSTAYYNDYSYRIHWHPESGGCANCPVKNGTIGQLTGLHDANGVDVYEGDIVEVERVDDCFGESNYIERDIVSYPTYEELEARSTGGPDGCDSVVRIAVIGNIHQHPELLTK